MRTGKILIKNGTPKKKITVMQCNTEYPTPLEDVNLRVIQTFKKKFNIDVGYSDHTLGIDAVSYTHLRAHET